MSAAAHNPSRRRRELLIGGFSVALALTGAALGWSLHGLAAPATGLRVPWWALAAVFAVTELCAVHVHFRRGAHSFTLGEMPLVLGLLFAAPSDVVLAWVAGGAVVLAAGGRMPALRVLFNLGQFAVTAGLAGSVFAGLGGPGSHSDPRLWLAAGAGAVASAAVSALLVAAAMGLSGERMALRRVRDTLAMAIGVATTNASLALAAGAAIAADPRATPLLLAPAAAIVVAYRAYTAERARHERLEFLYEASRALSRGADIGTGLAGTLALALETFRAEVAEVAMFPAGDDGPGSRVAIGRDDRLAVLAPLPDGVGAELRELVDGEPAARAIEPAAVGGALERHLRALGVRSAMLAPLPGERAHVGAMLVANRLGVGGAFDRDERRLFETLARHTGSALGQDRLEGKLAELRELQRELEHQAFHDPLTGLANRLLFMDRVQHALSRRTGNVVVIYIDLDDFKGINDTLGHEAGDAVLTAVGDRLRSSLRAADTPARLGGDEFAVLLVDLPDEHVRVVADRILGALASPLELPGRERGIRASVGVAVADSGSMAADELLRNADLAMYATKHGGKDGYRIHHPGLAAPAPEPALA